MRRWGAEVGRIVEKIEITLGSDPNVTDSHSNFVIGHGVNSSIDVRCNGSYVISNFFLNNIYVILCIDRNGRRNMGCQKYHYFTELE